MTRPGIRITGTADDSQLLRLDTWPYQAVQVLGPDGRTLGIPLTPATTMRLADAMHAVLRDEINATAARFARLLADPAVQEAIRNAPTTPPSQRGAGPPVSAQEYLRLLDERTGDDQ